MEQGFSAVAAVSFYRKGRAKTAILLQNFFYTCKDSTLRLFYTVLETRI